jgi:uncharacterized protein
MSEYFWGHVQFKAIVGSQAYGLAHEGSDEDWRGWYTPPTEDFFGMYQPPEQLVATHGIDATFWELAKFLRLLTDNNPNVLETLWSPVVEFPNPNTEAFARKIIAHRKDFLTQKIINTYGGYATQQKGRGLQYLKTPGQEAHGWKHLMHLCRLLISGREALLTGDLMVDVGEYRETLLAIRRGEWQLQDLLEWHRELEERFDFAKTHSVLPEKATIDLADALLKECRRLLYV